MEWKTSSHLHRFLYDSGRATVQEMFLALEEAKELALQQSDLPPSEEGKVSHE